MTPVNDSTYITNYALGISGEGVIEAAGTNSNGTLLTNTLKFTAVYYPPKSQGMLTANFAALEVPAGALRTGGLVVMAESSGQSSLPGLQRVTPTVDVALPVTRLDVPARLRLPVKGPLAIDAARLGLFAETAEGAAFLGRASLADGKVQAPLEVSGSLFAAMDTQPPVFAAVPEPAGPGRVSLRVVESGSGLDPDSLKVTYGQEPLPFTWNEAAGRLDIETAGLLDGRYTLTVAAADRLGNTAEARISAQVTGSFDVAQIVTWPNPAREFAMIRAAFTGVDAAALAVEATIKDAAGDEVFSTTLTHKGGGVYEARWPLSGSRGRHVANGVYYVTVEADSAAGRIKERRKLAVLR